MLRLTLLLACAASLGSSTVVLEQNRPIMWNHATDQLADISPPDPWHYLHRMSLYKVLIASTDKYMGSMGTGETESPIWGLPLQLGWMKVSGRLADPTGVTTCGLETGDTNCISPTSWWGCVNYFGSVLPFLSAVKQGMMGDNVEVTMTTTAEGVAEFCTTYDSCVAQYPDAMNKWDKFYEALKTQPEATVTELERKDSLLGLYWDAQMASTYSSATCNDRLSHYSTVEKPFIKSWLNSAEYVSAAHFQSSMNNTVMFITPLPSRILKEGDVAPNIADLTEDENHTLYIFGWMDTINTFLGGSLVRSWKSAMCSTATREKGRDMLGKLLLDSSYATTSFVSIITEMSSSC